MAQQSWLSPRCNVCGQSISGGLLYMCPACSTPHHAECWEYTKGCSTYGCTESGSMRPAQSLPALPEGPRFSVAQRVLLASLWIPASIAIFLGICFTTTFPVAGLLMMIAGYATFLLGWRGSVRPLAVDVKALGTLCCLVMGASSASSILLGLIMLAAGIPLAAMPLSLIGLGAALGGEVFSLFHALDDRPRALEAPPEPPLITEAERMRLEKARLSESAGNEEDGRKRS